MQNNTRRPPIRKTFVIHACGFALLAVLCGSSFAQTSSAPVEANSPSPTTAPTFGPVTTGPFVVTVSPHNEEPSSPRSSGVNHELLWLAGIIAVAYIAVRLLTFRARRARQARDRQSRFEHHDPGRR